MTTSWREFEQLVARIEESLAPTGAKVTSPDRVKDLVSGRLREVDASIRYNVGSAHILLPLEGRTRRGVQDDTWIEQLATKRAKIGAAKTIAVSATGFSESAVKTAQLYGIELRTLQDRIGEEIVQQFVSGMKMSLIITDYSARTIAFELEGGVPLPAEELAPEIAEAFDRGEPEIAVITHPATGKGFTVQELLFAREPPNLPEDGSIVPTRVQIGFKPRTFTIATKRGARFLARVEIVADFTKRVVPAPATGLFEYAAPNKTLRRTIEAVGQISETEGIRLQVDVESPTLDRRSQAKPKRRRSGM